MSAGTQSPEQSPDWRDASLALAAHQAEDAEFLGLRPTARSALHG